MATIISPGLGSGLDINSLVSGIVSAEGDPVRFRLDQKEATLQAKLSAFGSLKGALSSLQSAMGNLNSVGTFQSRSTSVSDSSVFSATAGSSAGTGTYNITVSALSAPHTLASGAFSAETDVVGNGTLTFKFGTTDYDAGTDTYNSFTQNPEKATQTVTIDATNNTLAGIRDAVNAADIGVSASIINDGSGYRLVFVSSDTGASNSLQVSVDEGTGTPSENLDTTGLSQLAFNSGATNLQQTAAAQDASFTINGLSVTSPSDKVTGAIEGVTLDLKAAGSATLTVSRDTAAASKAIDTFVSEYNKVVDLMSSLSSYDPESQAAGTLLGDSTLRSIGTQMRRIIGNVVDGLGGNIDSLAALGITTDTNTGRLVKDDTKIQNALDNNFDSIAGLFADFGTPTDALVDFISAGENTKVGSYGINITQLATQGVYTGGDVAAFPLTVDANNDTFALKVDGIQSGTITLTQGSYASGAELAAELQARINGDSNLQGNGVSVTVTYNSGAPDAFVITSNRYGSASKVEITAVDTNTTADLGLSIAAGTDGVDVAGTIGGAAATGSGRELTGTGDAGGLKIEIVGGVLGDRGSISFSRGYASQLDGYLSGILEGEGLIDSRTSSLSDSIEGIGDEREKLAARLEALEARYRAQFNALDVLVAQLRSTSDFLMQQLASLPGARMAAGR